MGTEAEGALIEAIEKVREIARECARTPGLEEIAVRLAVITKDLPHLVQKVSDGDA